VEKSTAVTIFSSFFETDVTPKWLSAFCRHKLNIGNVFGWFVVFATQVICILELVTEKLYIYTKER